MKLDEGIIKYNKKEKKTDWLLEIWCVLVMISTPFLTMLISNRYTEAYILIGSMVSFIIAIITISYMSKKGKIKKFSTKKGLLILVISLYCIKQLSTFARSNISLFSRVFNGTLSPRTLVNILGILSIPSIMFLVQLFIDQIFTKIVEFKKSLTKMEKYYLLIVFVIATFLTIGVTMYTNAFTKPSINERAIVYDVVYTTDSGLISKENAFLNISSEPNDIRQPLFGIFAFPFAIIGKFISEITFFLPQGFAYEIIMTIIQFILVAISTILIGRMLKLEEKDKKYLYLLFNLSFPYILFSIAIEQYVIGTFYLILAIYIYILNKDKINYMYIGATGTLLTSGVIFPMITTFKNTKQWILDMLKCFLGFMAILIVGGQLPQILIIGDYLELLKFARGTTIYEKICQYTYWIKGLFIPQEGNMEIFKGNPSYQLTDINSISILGIIILIIMCISFIMNRKEKIAKISILWILFSAWLLGILGWGTVENGLILYSLYFAWAFYILYFLLIKKVFKNRKLFISIIIISIIVITVLSINQFVNILEFAFKYYPNSF